MMEITVNEMKEMLLNDKDLQEIVSDLEINAEWLNRKKCLELSSYDAYNPKWIQKKRPENGAQARQNGQQRRLERKRRRLRKENPRNPSGPCLPMWCICHRNPSSDDTTYSKKPSIL